MSQPNKSLTTTTANPTTCSMQVHHLQVPKLKSEPPEKRIPQLVQCKTYSYNCKSHIRNGFMPHIMWHKLSHIYASEVRWNFEFDSWYSSKICLSLPKNILHSLYLLFLIMLTLKGDVRVKIFYFTFFLFLPYVKKGEYHIEFVCGNVIF